MKNSQKLFFNPKCRNGRKHPLWRPNFDQKCQFWSSYTILSSSEYGQNKELQVHKQCPCTHLKTPERLWKSPKNDFIDPKNDQKSASQLSQIYEILNENNVFRCQSSTFGYEYTSINEPFKFKNNALILNEQLQINFEKVPKIIFLTQNTPHHR